MNISKSNGKKKNLMVKQQTINQIMWKRSKQNSYTIQYHTHTQNSVSHMKLKLSQKKKKIQYLTCTKLNEFYNI